MPERLKYNVYALYLSRITITRYWFSLKSAETKVPKAEREDTKYPGTYEGEKYHFKLTKTLTSARTKDIKGFAYDEHNCAIVKRKTFNLSDGFAFIKQLLMMEKLQFLIPKILIFF